MNIQEAKEEVIRSVRAYTAKDAQGCYRIPPLRQRPVLLMGPPGIGKTAVMEQAAEACGVGLVAYTITHHTRQSAVGLPKLMPRIFDGREYTVTEYTMSEIIGSVYEYQERTGFREGILFIDEINCVSETLAPTMLQFLQYKTFGNHKVPKGWVIVAAGNPPECNRSVRELDMAALDRVRVLDVEADFSVWKDYAISARVHPAVLSYLELHPQNFYRVALTRDKREFVTARGWEDLSALLREYERQAMPVGQAFMGEFIRMPAIASDFASFYQLYRTYMGRCRMEGLMEGTMEEGSEAFLQELGDAPGDVRCMFLRHLLSAASERMRMHGERCRLWERKKEVLGQFASYRKREQPEKPEDFLKQRAHALLVREQNGLLKPWEERLERMVDEWLKELLLGPGRMEFLALFSEDGAGIEELLQTAGLLEAKREIEAGKEALLRDLNRVTGCLHRAFGEDAELADWLCGIRNHGDYRYCGFSRPEYAGLLEERRQEERLRKTIHEMEGFYETADFV